MAKPLRQPIDKPERARQLARAIASDISLYNEAKIVEGIEQDNLFDMLSNEISEGRDLFNKRVAEPLHNLNIYDRALVDVLVKSKGHVKSKMW